MPDIKPIAKVIDNNQAGWKNIIETAPNVTLPVGTELYLVDEPEVKPDFYSTKDGLVFKNGERVTSIVDELNRLSFKNVDYVRRLVNPCQKRRGFIASDLLALLGVIY